MTCISAYEKMEKFAIVYFTKDRMFDIVPVCNIRRFREETWSKNKIYHVKWTGPSSNSTKDTTTTSDYSDDEVGLIRASSSQSGTSGHGSTDSRTTSTSTSRRGKYTRKPTSSKSDVYPAFVIRLSESKTELSSLLDSDERLRIPNVQTRITEPVTTDGGEDDGDVAMHISQLVAKKKEQTASHKAAKNKRMQDILKRKRSAPLATDGPTRRFHGVSSSSEEEVAELPHKSRQMSDMQTVKDKRINELEQENSKLRKMNDNLQDILASKFQESRSEYSAVSDNSKCTDSIQNKTEKVDSLLTEVEIKVLDTKRKPTIFVKNLAMRLFGTETLRSSSLDGTVSNRCKGTRPARPPLSPRKVNFIKLCVLEHYGAGEVKLVNKCLSEKIADLRKGHNKVPVS